MGVYCHLIRKTLPEISSQHFLSHSAKSYQVEMPVIKHYYFDFPFWRAEVSRLSLILGNVPFEDVRIKSLDEFKASGKAPVLEVDGKLIAQTGAIARYCGKQGGFYPRDDDFAAAKIDEIIDTATDITNALGKTFRMEEEEKKAARVVLATETLPKFFAALEKMMTENGSTGFYVGKSMTIADLAMWRLLGWVAGGALDGIPKDLVESYPQLNSNMIATGSIEKVKSYMAEKYPNLGK